MPSFDIVSRVEMQEIDNAVNNTVKAIQQRFDFRGSKTEVTLDKKEKKIRILTEDKMKMEAVKEMLQQNAVKRKIDLKTLKFEEPQPAAGSQLRREVTIKEGIDQDTAKKIVKLIKDAKMKVQASIQGDEVRVSGKKIDDLQQAIALVRGAGLDLPLQFVNMKS
jgi:uncharacterized protein YajQ (UPF0234 family)